MNAIYKCSSIWAFFLTMTTFCITGAQTRAAAQMPLPSANAPRSQNETLALSAEEVQTRLQKSVHLILGSITLPQLTAALSEQTGLRVEAAEYLRERKLVVQLNGVSASAALNALGELNEWAWSDKGGGQIIILRRLPVLRQEPENIPARARAALPKDIRAFCRIGSVYDHSPQVSVRDAEGNDNDNSGLFRPSILAGNLRRNLIDSLRPGIISGAEVTWKRLTLEQQQAMTGILLFETLNKTSSRLHGGLLPFLADPTLAFLQMQGNTFSIMTQRNPDTLSGFGTEVKPRKEEQ